MRHFLNSVRCSHSALCLQIVEKGNSLKFLPGNGPPVGDSCVHCGFRHQMGGPLWTESIYQPAFVEAVKSHLVAHKEDFASQKRILGIVTALSEELTDRPLFHDLSVLASTLHCQCPSNAAVVSAVRNAGFQLSQSHTSPLALKTDAPMEVLWDIMRAWVKDHPVKPPKEGSPAFQILAKESTTLSSPDFTIRPEYRQDKVRPKPASSCPRTRCLPGTSVGGARDALYVSTV